MLETIGTIRHWNPDIKTKQDFGVSFLDNGIRIKLEGYGADMSCIYVELDDHPRVIVYGDSAIDEPTHIISLKDAKDD